MTEIKKAGFISIIGKPNAGKSTLLNAILGQKLAITNSKAQTTRHRIVVIHPFKDCQMVFSDTPGIINPAYKLQEEMMSAVNESIHDADVLVILIDVTSFPDVQVGDQVTLLGRNGDDMITAEEWANKVGSITYEVFCNISKRVPRVPVNL